MYYYQAYGLNIYSQLGLFQLPVQDAISDVPPDLTISLEPIQFDPQDQSLPYPYLKLKHDEVVFAITSLAKYQVRYGKEIVVDPEPGADDTLVQGYLVGVAMAILLNQRGRLVLHASAVNIDGCGIAFLGSSGMGKSSTAASFLARGHTLLVDDVVAIEFRTHRPIFFPGFPHLKLAPEAAQSIHAGDLQLHFMDEFDEKYNYRLSQNSSGQPIEIKRIYILSEGSTVEIERISIQQAVIEMVRYSMPASMVILNRAEHLHKCTKLASSIECYRLKRPLSLDMLPQLAEKVEEHVTTAFV